MPGKSKTGETYFYFMCSGRQKHTCDLPYFKIDQVERAVEDNYATVTLSPALRALITSSMRAAINDSDATGGLMRDQLTRQLTEINTKIDALLDLVGHPDWPNDRLTAKMSARREEKARVQHQLDQLVTPNLDQGHSALTTLLDLLGDARRLYRVASNPTRKVLNQVFFTRLYLDERDGAPVISCDEPTDVIRPLVEAQRNPHGASASAAGQHNGDTAEIDGTAAKITPYGALAHRAGWREFE